MQGLQLEIIKAKRELAAERDARQAAVSRALINADEAAAAVCIIPPLLPL
jgi:hypothetical protein